MSMRNLAKVVRVLFDKLIEFEHTRVLPDSLVIVPHGYIGTFSSVTQPTIKGSDVGRAEVGKGLNFAVALQGLYDKFLVAESAVTKLLTIDFFTHELDEVALK